METPSETFGRALHEIVGVPYAPRVRSVRRTLGGQVQLQELGAVWSCDFTFTVTDGCVDEFETVALSANAPRGCPWIDVDFDCLSQRSQDAITREAYAVLRDSHDDRYDPEFHPL